MSISGAFNFVARGLNFAGDVVDSTLINPEKTLTQVALSIIPKAVRGLRKATQKLFEKSITWGAPGMAELTFLTGADVNALDADGETALHKAVRANDLESIKWLREHWAQLDIVSSSGQSPLGLAIQMNLLNCAKILIENGATVAAKRHSVVWSNNELLWKAADSEDKELFELLLKKGANINDRNLFGETVFHRVAELGDLEWGKYMMQKKASLEIKNMNGVTPFIMAVGQMLWNLLPLTRAQDEFIDFMIERGGDINSQDVNGRTLLHMAVEKGNVDTVKYLLSKGAKNLRDGQGKTPMKLAKERMDEVGEAICSLLLDAHMPKN